MSKYKIQSEFAGHSGCKIYLMESEERNRFVRKISKSASYNLRLEIQCRKQSEFTGQTIRAPKIFSSGFDENGLFYFDMEYINGISLAKYIRKIETAEIREMTNLLTAQMKPFAYKGYEDNSKIFFDKISDLEKKIDSDLMKRALKILSEHDWKNFPRTFCHGDLTPENIIISRGNLYYIDFLDSFFDCFILDVAALLQDAQCMWCYRYEKNLDVNTKIRLMIFRDLLLEKMTEFGVSQKDIYCALLLKLLRIVPYASDKVTKDFLNLHVERAINFFGEIEK